MSQPVGTQSIAPKNQLSVFNPANFFRDEVEANATALAQESYISNSNTAQSAQISTNDTTITNLFTPEPSIYVATPPTLTSVSTTSAQTLATIPTILNKKKMQTAIEGMTGIHRNNLLATKKIWFISKEAFKNLDWF
jgi:hypothetical protein